jgi:hypothetical protein
MILAMATSFNVLMEVTANQVESQEHAPIIQVYRGLCIPTKCRIVSLLRPPHFSYSLYASYVILAMKI